MSDMDGNGQDFSYERPVSRREFLKLAGIAGAMLGAGAGLGGLLAACGSGSTTTTTAATTATSGAGGTVTTVAAAGGSVGPFNGGSGGRTQIVVISDLHMGADLAYAEFNKNTKPLVNFLGQVQGSPTVKELVIAGDLVDEWFVPATTDTYAGKDQADFVKRVASTNQEVFDGLNRIIQEGNVRVTYVPGNHDLTVTAANIESILPGINQARDDVLGLGTYLPEGHPEIAIEHSHRYNFFCAPDPISNRAVAPGSILPPGYFYTRTATLSVVQKCSTPGEVLPQVTQDTAGGDSQALAYAYWSVWKALLTSCPIENTFDEKIVVTNVNGFAETYAVDDFLPFQETPGGPISMNLYKNSLDTWDERQTLNHVPVHIPTQQAVTDSPSNTATDAQATTQYFANPESNARIVVFGHTHAPTLQAAQNHAGLKSLYVNSGTWIDSNPKQTTMHFVVITPQGTDSDSLTEVKLYNFENEVMTLMAEDSARV
jgi:UDP-2,3-diacylglucosamine pyrophosphatase LpxH